MASDVEIANRALQTLGAKTITALSDDSRNARSVNACFIPLRQKELRIHTWNFAVERVVLAASATAPTFERATAYPLPSDFLRLLAPDPEGNYNNRDWQIEGRSIITDDTGALNLRYIKDVTDPNLMDPLFREALAMSIAYNLAEPITQSNTKKKDAYALYNDVIAEAKKVNAIERIALEAPEDTWVTVRN